MIRLFVIKTNAFTLKSDCWPQFDVSAGRGEISGNKLQVHGLVENTHISRMSTGGLVCFVRNGRTESIMSPERINNSWK